MERSVYMYNAYPYFSKCMYDYDITHMCACVIFSDIIPNSTVLYMYQLSLDHYPIPPVR